MRKTLLALMTTSTFFTAAPALAADGTSTTLPAINVTAEKESLVVPSVQAAKEKIDLIPGGVALVPAEEFENTQATTIKDMLDYTPGVFAQKRVAEESRLSIRGSGLSRTYHLRGITLLQDDVPINLADGSSDFQNIDPLAFRYVEVYKGANALKYGANTLGGAINFVTPTGYDASKLEARIDGGSFGTLREHLSSGQVIGNTDYYASFTHMQSDGYRDASDQNNTRFSGNIGQKLSENLETRFYINYGDINQHLPGNLTKAQLEANPKQANSVSENNNYQRDYTSYRIANKTTWQGDGVEVNGGVYTTQKSLYHPIFQLIDQDSSDYGAFANSTISNTIAGKRNELTIGTNLSTNHVDADRYVNVKGAYGALTSSGKQTANNVNIYGENRFYVIPELALIAGSGFLYAEREYDDLFLTNGDQSGKKDYYGTTPKIGALWEVTHDIQLFTNVSRAYEPPTFSEVEQNLAGVSGFSDIKAQKSTTFEVGSRGNWSRMNWDVSVYRSWLKDELMMYSVGNNGQTGVINADDTIHQGVELGLGLKLAEGLLEKEGSKDTLKTRLAYTYSDFHFENDPTWGDNQIPGAPKYYIRTELRYEHPLGFYIAPNLEWVPEGYAVDMANTLFTDPYTLLGLQAGYDITKNVTFFVDARNLTDKTYAATTDVITQATTANSAVFTPGDGRSVYAGLTYKW